MTGRVTATHDGRPLDGIAAIAYSRPVGNVDPDEDPESSVSTLSSPIIVLS